MSTLDATTAKIPTGNVEQLDSTELEVYIKRLTKAFNLDFDEQFEKQQKGFSFKSSLKDVSRNLIKFLLIKGGTETTLDILARWNYFIAATKDKSGLKPEEEEKFAVFCQAYYLILDYFKNQIRTHLGEKIDFDSSKITSPVHQNFIKHFGLKQRNYPQYTLNKIWLENLLQSAVRSLEIQDNERELTELLNLIFLYKNHPDIVPETAEILVMNLSDKFPQYKRIFEDVLKIENQLHIGESIVEASPPFEDYSFQHNLMTRVYTLTENGYVVNQYALPYEEAEQNLFHTALSASSTRIRTLGTASRKSNSILANMYISRIEQPQKILNLFPSIVEHGGTTVMNEVEAIIRPEVEELVEATSPFIEEVVGQIPMMMYSQELMNQYAGRYKEVFSAAVASKDKSILAENPLVSSALSDLSILREAVSGGDTSKALSTASGGVQESVDFSKQGDCDTFDGSIGKSAESGDKAFSQAEIEGMKFNGNIMDLTKNGDIDLKLQSFIDKDGKEHKLFVCPVCKAKGIVTYVDICNSACNKCNTSTQDMRLNAEKGNLGQYAENVASGNYSNSSESGIGGGIGDVFSNLLEAIFGFMNF